MVRFEDEFKTLDIHIVLWLEQIVQEVIWNVLFGGQWPFEVDIRRRFIIRFANHRLKYGELLLNNRRRACRCCCWLYLSRFLPRSIISFD